MWKIGICTNDGANINEHFGQCAEVSIYTVKANGETEFTEKRSILPAHDNADELTDHDWRLKQKAELLQDCDYLLCQKIGNRAVRILSGNGVSPLEHDGSIDEALAKLSKYLRSFGKANTPAE